MLLVSIAWYEEMKITLWVFLVWRQISCHPAQVLKTFLVCRVGKEVTWSYDHGKSDVTDHFQVACQVKS